MIRGVAVIGAGVMGHGIAQLYAQAGFRVRLSDVAEDRLASALRTVEGNLALLVEEGVLARSEAAAALGRIEPTTDLVYAVTGADFVTEAIPELLDAKQDLLDSLERSAPATAIIASNTSTFPIGRLAARARSPERMIITHYLNPAPLVPLVEVLAHPRTRPEVVATTLDLMRRIGKTPVLLRKEVAGFIVNRLQTAIAREAFHLVQEGVVDARDIDAVVTEGPGFRWAFIGPIATADFGGLDTWQRVIENLAPDLGRSETAPAVLAECVRRGDLGTKTGRGIYSYEGVSLPDLLRERDRGFIRLLKLRAEARPPDRPAAASTGTPGASRGR